MYYSAKHHNSIQFMMKIKN